MSLIINRNEWIITKKGGSITHLQVEGACWKLGRLENHRSLPCMGSVVLRNDT